MSFLLDLFQYIAKCLRWSLFGLMSLPGLIVSGVVGVLSLVVSLFTGFDMTTEIVNKIDQAAAYLDDQFGVIRNGSSAVLDMLVSFLAVDTFVECMVLLVTTTVALVVATFCTFLLAVLLLSCSILLIRGILKLIRVCSAGFIDP